MSLPVPRVTLTAAILLASMLLHLGLLGLIVLADRRVPTTRANEAIEVELVAPPPELPKEEPPQPEPPKPEPPKPEAQKSEPATPLAQPEPPAQASPQETQPPEPPAETAAPAPQDQPQLPEPKPDKPEAAPGGFAGEGKTKLTPEEIAALRAQVQKCWTLPVGLPNAMKLEAVLRVSLARNGAITAGPELMKANASAGGPVLVGIAMKALRDCAPYRLPAAKYAEWRTLDLRFLATGLAGLGSARPPKG